MVDEQLKRSVLQNICSLKDRGYQVVIVHGGGPFIKEALETARIESEFIDGHRKTPPEAFEHVEMALKGKVNGSLVSLINSLGYKAVGLSGKDGMSVVAKKRKHQRTVNGTREEVDLGQVGDVDRVDTALINLLLDKDYIPVIACVAADAEGNGYNINADMFAGHMAGALKASQYVVLTDVDGLLKDRHDPSSLIRQMNTDRMEALLQQEIIQGGMIPKTASCEIAIQNGARSARIINGTQPNQILSMIEDSPIGTLITES